MKYNLNLVSNKIGLKNSIKFYERDRKKKLFLYVTRDVKNQNFFLTVNVKKVRNFFEKKDSINFSFRSRHLFNLNDLKI